MDTTNINSKTKADEIKRLCWLKNIIKWVTVQTTYITSKGLIHKMLQIECFKF